MSIKQIVRGFDSSVDVIDASALEIGMVMRSVQLPDELHPFMVWNDESILRYVGPTFYTTEFLHGFRMDLQSGCLLVPTLDRCVCGERLWRIIAGDFSKTFIAVGRQVHPIADQYIITVLN